MIKDKLLKSAIKNDYIKKINSVDGLKMAIQSAIKNHKEDNSRPFKLCILNNNTKIEVSQNDDGIYIASII